MLQNYLIDLSHIAGWLVIPTLWCFVLLEMLCYIHNKIIYIIVSAMLYTKQIYINNF